MIDIGTRVKVVNYAQLDHPNVNGKEGVVMETPSGRAARVFNFVQLPEDAGDPGVSHGLWLFSDDELEVI